MEANLLIWIAFRIGVMNEIFAASSWRCLRNPGTTRQNFFQVTVKHSMRCPTRTNILIWPIVASSYQEPAQMYLSPEELPGHHELRPSVEGICHLLYHCRKCRDHKLSQKCRSPVSKTRLAQLP